jgi:hypothetical protein
MHAHSVVGTRLLTTALTCSGSLSRRLRVGIAEHRMDNFACRSGCTLVAQHCRRAANVFSQIVRAQQPHADSSVVGSTELDMQVVACVSLCKLRLAF